MPPVSVVVTAHNCEPYLSQTLKSLADALAVFERDRPLAPEVVIVDDGSTDGTPAVCHAFATGRSGWKVVRRPRQSSPSCARNAGARASTGSVLFFLDGDDLFLPDHRAACCRLLAEGADFVKTGVRLSDPVHADWKERIENSLVLNLAVRRSLHEAVGGFPDHHLFRREGEEMRPTLDVFYKVEDLFYNRLVGRPGRKQEKCDRC